MKTEKINQNQTNFEAIKSIKYKGIYNELPNKKGALTALKNNPKAMKFFEKYDVNIVFNAEEKIAGTIKNSIEIFYKKPAKGLFQKIRSAFSNDKKCIKVLDFNYITRSFDNIIQKISPKNEHSRVSGYLDYLIDEAEKENLLTEKK